MKLTNTRVYTHSSYSANVSVIILRMASKVHCISTVCTVNISFQKSLSLQRVYKTEFDSQIISKYKRTKFITRKVKHFKPRAKVLRCTCVSPKSPETSIKHTWNLSLIHGTSLSSSGVVVLSMYVLCRKKKDRCEDSMRSLA